MESLSVVLVPRTDSGRDDNICFDTKAQACLNDCNIGDTLPVALGKVLLHLEYVVFLIRPDFLVLWRAGIRMITQN